MACGKPESNFMNSAFDIISRRAWNVFCAVDGAATEVAFPHGGVCWSAVWMKDSRLLFPAVLENPFSFGSASLRWTVPVSPSLLLSGLRGLVVVRLCVGLLCFHCTSVCRGKCALTFPWWQWWEPRAKRSIESNFSFTGWTFATILRQISLHKRKHVSSHVNNHVQFGRSVTLCVFLKELRWQRRRKRKEDAQQATQNPGWGRRGPQCPKGPLWEGQFRRHCEDNCVLL